MTRPSAAGVQYSENVEPPVLKLSPRMWCVGGCFLPPKLAIGGEECGGLVA